MTRTQRHIEEYRKGTALIQVRDTSGCGLAGISVSVEQETHEFLFACVTGDLSAFSQHYRHRHKLRLREVFNRIYCARELPSSASDVAAVDVPERVHVGALRRTLDHYASGRRDLDVYISGRSVALPCRKEQPDLVAPTERDVAYRVVELYTLCFSHPAVRQIVWKGFSDREADTAEGGLLRRDLSPKHAHKFLRKLVGTTWHSRAIGQTDSRGMYRFRGFFGTYRVIVTFDPAKAHVSKLSLSRGAVRPRPFIVEIPIGR